MLRRGPTGGEREAQVRFLDAEGINLQVFRAVRRFLQHLAGQRPLVVVLEDWHWADDASVQLLEHLLPLTRAVPLLVVCTTRPQQDGPPARLIDAVRREVAGRSAVVRLIPLSDAASAELAGEASGLGALPPGLRELVLRRAEATPSFWRRSSVRWSTWVWSAGWPGAGGSSARRPGRRGSPIPSAG